MIQQRTRRGRGTFRTAAAIAIVVAMALGGCRGAGRDNDDQSAAPAEPAMTMAVSAAPAIVAPMRRELRLLGTTVAMRHVQLRAPAAGRLLGFNLQIGDRVRRGEIVADVRSREIEAAENGLAVARQLDPDEAAALAGAVRRHSAGGGVAIIAPADGIVAERIVSSGQMVNDMDPIADLIDPASVYVEAAVPIDDLAQLRPGLEAMVTSSLRPGIEFAARVAALAPSFSVSGATAPARVEFVGPARITETGAPVDVSITLAVVPDAIVIPAAALFDDAANGTAYVFVAGADGRAHRTPVTLGIRDAAQVQVTSGLNAGAMVITSGGYALADGLKVTVAGPGN